MQTINVAIADDHKLFSSGVAGLLNGMKGVKCLFEASNGKEVLEELERRKIHPDIILMDINMPVMDGIEATEKIKKDYPDIKIIILSMHDEELYIAHLIKKGALGYLLKNTDPKEMERAINAVYEDGYYFTPNVVKAMHRSISGRKSPVANFTSSGHSLSEREYEILQYICKEMSTKQIADQLSLSPKTIEGHRTKLLEKLNAKNSVGLAIYALREGIVDL